MMRFIQELSVLFEGVDFPWPICGGLAVDLFLGRETRTHGDIDLSIAEPDRDKVIAHMLGKGWRVYEYRGGGVVRPVTGPEQSEPGRNLMCLRDGCELVKFYSFQEGLLYHEFVHTGMEKLDFLDLLFHPTEDVKPVLERDGIPFLAPEAVLLYKASDPERAENQRDFKNVYPMLNEKQRRWLHENLARIYPEHSWRLGEVDIIL